ERPCPPRRSKPAPSAPTTCRWRGSSRQVSLDGQPAAVAAEVLDRDERAARAGQPLAPLDHHRARVQELVETYVANFVVLLEAVEVDMSKLHAASIDAHQLESRARHLSRRSGSPSHPAHERGLARPELAFQEDEVAGAQPPAELLAGGLGLDGRRGVTRNGRSQRASSRPVSRLGRPRSPWDPW